jgi:hypothetical protein
MPVLPMIRTRLPFPRGRFGGPDGIGTRLQPMVAGAAAGPDRDDRPGLDPGGRGRPPWRRPGASPHLGGAVLGPGSGPGCDGRRGDRPGRQRDEVRVRPGGVRAPGPPRLQPGDPRRVDADGRRTAPKGPGGRGEAVGGRRRPARARGQPLGHLDRVRRSARHARLRPARGRLPRPRALRRAEPGPARPHVPLPAVAPEPGLRETPRPARRRRGIGRRGIAGHPAVLGGRPGSRTGRASLARRAAVGPLCDQWGV